MLMAGHDVGQTAVEGTRHLSQVLTYFRAVLIKCDMDLDRRHPHRVHQRGNDH